MAFRRNGSRPRVARRAPKFKWCGAFNTQLIPSFPTITDGENQRVCPQLGSTDQEAQGQVTLMRTHIWVSIRRVLNTADIVLAGTLWVAQLNPGTGALSFQFDPQSALDREIAHRDVLWWGHFDVPAAPTHSGGTSVIARDTIATHLDIPVKRVLHRANHALVFTLTSNTTDVCRSSVFSRALLKYSS